MNYVKILNGEIDLDYKWNPGPTIGKFLTNLRDHKEISAVRCNVTSRVFLPPQGCHPMPIKKWISFLLWSVILLF